MDGNPELVNLIVQYSWLGIFVFYLFFDFFIPIPEEFSIITFAYIFTSSAYHMFWGWLLILIAILMRSVILFYLAHNRAGWVVKFAGKRKDRIEKLKIKMEKNLPKTLIILNMIPKIRLATPIIAGLSRVTPSRFLKFQSLILLIYVSVNYLLGMLFYSTMAKFFRHIENMQHSEYFIIFIIASTVVSFFLGRYLLKKYFRE